MRWGVGVHTIAMDATYDQFQYMHSSQTCKCFPSASKQLASTIEIPILKIALAVAVHSSVIGVAVSDLVSISSPDMGTDVPSPVLISVFIVLRISAFFDMLIGTFVAILTLTQSMTREFSQ